MKRLMISVMVLITSICLLFFVSCGSSSESKNATGWDYFETINRIGDSYEDVSNDFDTLFENDVYNGGITLQVDDDLFFSFPALSKDEIKDSDSCTGMYGTLYSLFNIEEDISIDELKELLTISSRPDYENGRLYTKNATSGSYYVCIYIEDESEDVGPDIGASVIVNNNTNYDSEDMPDEDVDVDLFSVDSTALSRIGYDYEHNVLAVEFKDSGECYYYYDVPEDVFEGLKSADSKGEYYNDKIKRIYYSIRQ